MVTTADPPVSVPDLGRTVHIVGPVANVDPKQTPHPKNQRGELGKALYNWRHNTVSNDPITRIVFENHCADRNRAETGYSARTEGQGQQRTRTPVGDPAAMTRHIKRVARYLGLDVVGIGKSHPSFLYAGKAIDPMTGADGEALDRPDVLANRLPFIITGSVAWNYEMTKAHRHRIGDAAYDFTGQKTNLIFAALEWLHPRSRLQHAAGGRERPGRGAASGVRGGSAATA